MQLATNLILYIFLSIGVGYILRSIKDEEGIPKLKWYIGGIIIGLVCGIANGILVSTGSLFGAGFNLDTVLGGFIGGDFVLVSGAVVDAPSDKSETQNVVALASVDRVCPGPQQDGVIATAGIHRV